MNFLVWVLCLLLLFFQSYENVFPHIIWMYWNRGFQNMGGFQRLCVSRAVEVHQNTDWQLRLVQESTIKNWLNEINYKKLRESIDSRNGVTVQGQSDFIRYYLLKQHGGVWLDVSILLYQNLNWLDDILSNPLVIHKNVFTSPQVFFFSTFWGYSKGQSKNIKYKGHEIHPILNMESSFIAAIKQSPYINDQIQMMDYLLKKKKHGFDTFKQYYKFQYNYSEYFRVFGANWITQYRKYQKFQIAMHENNSLEKNINKLYQILTINKNRILYHIQEEKAFFKYYFEPEGRPFGNYGRYLRKFHHFGQKQIIQNVLNRNNKQILNSLLLRENSDFAFWVKYIRQDYKCLQYYQIREDSIINKYLIANYQLAISLYPKLRIYKEQELPFICRWTDLMKIRSVMPVIIQWRIYGIFLFAIAEIFVEFSLHIFTNSSQYLPGQNKSEKKKNLWRKLLLLITIYAEKDLILDQYELWLIESPTALFVIFFMVIWCIFFIHFIVNNHSSRFNIIRSKFFQLYFCIMILIQYFIQYNTAIWKYQGQVYNYFKIQEQNMITMQKSQNFLIKILLLVFCYYLLIVIKKIFLLQIPNRQSTKIQVHQFHQKLTQDQVNFSLALND